jgi:lambda family phage portal protein
VASPPRILDSRGRPLERPAPARAVRAKYDSAQTADDSRRHWANADALSARSANDPAVRRTLRIRARYETANNSYAAGMVETLANDLIGTGPRLQIKTSDPMVNRRVSAAFERWSSAVGLAEKLRTYTMARVVDGESFGLFRTNPMVAAPVKLDLRLVEADQVSTPYGYIPDALHIDGIQFDAYANPSEYFILREHPGDTYAFLAAYLYDRYPADLVVHSFKKRRPGQVRGVPDITPALPLFALLRRYTLAALQAAETAANFAALLETAMPPDSDGLAEGEPFENLEIVRGMMTTLPAGYKLSQFRAEQPGTNYTSFKVEILKEIARCLNIPFNVAAGDSSGYNYSSGRLDHQTYDRAVGVDRYWLECVLLNRLFDAWLEEARMADPGSVAGLEPGLPVRREWFWDGRSHVDPLKEANAAQRRLESGLTTLADEYAAEGHDWREKADQTAEERRYYQSLGIPYPGDKTTPMVDITIPPDGAPDGEPGQN